jgi:hypothetical protein
MPLWRHSKPRTKLPGPGRFIVRVKKNERNAHSRSRSMAVWRHYVMKVITPTPHFVIFAQGVLYPGAAFPTIGPEIVTLTAIGSILFCSCFAPLSQRVFDG